MYITIIALMILTLVLTILIGFRYRSDMSRFELKRRSEHSREYKNQYTFQAIYPGLRVFCAILGLVTALAICSVAYAQWQFVGTLIALGAIVLAILLSRVLKRVAYELIDGHLAWFNKYFAWTEILGRISLNIDEPQIHSSQELAHIIEKSDFIDEANRKMITGVMSVSDKKLGDVMTRRDKIITVKTSETMGPKLIDELHSSGHQIFPVIGKNIDDIIGTLYLDDVTIIDRGNRKLGDVMRPSLPTVDRNQTLVETLSQMVKRDVTVAIVIDDKGKVMGLVSLGDIVDVLFAGLL